MFYLLNYCPKFSKNAGINGIGIADARFKWLCIPFPLMHSIAMTTTPCENLSKTRTSTGIRYADVRFESPDRDVVNRSGQHLPWLRCGNFATNDALERQPHSSRCCGRLPCSELRQSQILNTYRKRALACDTRPRSRC